MRQILTCCLAVTAFAALPAAPCAAENAVHPQTNCPVTGQAVDKRVHLDVQGQRIYFCSSKCPAEFRKDPERYFAQIEKAGISLENIQTNCPVSGEKLGEGDMGAPVSIRYKGRTVQFCCRMCVKKFEADPAKYLAQLPGENADAR